MAAKTQASLQSDIDSNITNCGNGCITGSVLNNVLNDHVESTWNIIVGADISNNLSSGSSVGVPFIIRSSLIDYETTGNTDLFTVPNGVKLMVDAVEFVGTTNFAVASGNSMPEITFGFTDDRDAMIQAQMLSHFESGSRHIFSAFNLIDSGKTISVTVTGASTLSGTHQGYAVVHAYLMGV